MFSLVNEELTMIADAAQRLFADLAAEDRVIRQENGQRLAFARIRTALEELGLFGVPAETEAMKTAAVQVRIGIEAGAASLAFPALQTLSAHSQLRRNGSWIPALSTVQRADAELPTFRAGRIEGVCPLVAFPNAADVLLVEATDGSERKLMEVKPDAPGIERSARQSVEPDYRLEDLRFDNVEARPLTEVSTILLERRDALLASAEIAGACREMVAMTQQHLLTRTQFGQPLGANQALKHALADAHVKVEALIGLLNYAAAAVDAKADDALASAIAAKSLAGRTGTSVADAAFQMHGAIGYTMEFPLHLRMRRVYRLAVSHGETQRRSLQLFQKFEETLSYL